MKIPKLDQKNNQTHWSGFIGCSESLAISQLPGDKNKTVLVITTDNQQAARLKAGVEFFNQKSTPVQIFPDWETLPYDHFSPHQDITSERLSLLSSLSKNQPGIVIASVTTLMHRLLPQSHLKQHSLVLTLGETIDPESLRNDLVEAGYRHTGQVMEHGEFTSRGSIIDIFPMGCDNPFRIELFDNEVESIRHFDPETQRSQEKIDAIHLLPAHEYPLNEKGIAHFRQAWRQQFSGNPLEAPLYEQVSEAEAAAGLEYYIPLFFDETSTFFDYITDDTLIVFQDGIDQSMEQFWGEITHRYEQLRHDITRPICDYRSLYSNKDEVFSQIKPFKQLKISRLAKANAHFTLDSSQAPDITINSRISVPLTKLKNYINEWNAIKDRRILFCSESMGRRETLLDLLKESNIEPTVLDDWSACESSTTPISIITGPLENGVELNDLKLSIITESQLFGEQVKQQRYRKQQQLDPNTIIKSLTELSIGSPVVHIDHGVGRYLGMQILEAGGHEAEYLTLEYANQDKIYVPVGSLHLISRYTGADKDHAPLQKLGSKQWDKIKKKTAEQIRDVAAELLDIYSRRIHNKGFNFKINAKDELAFSAAFPFEPTPDQQTAIDVVRADMQSDRAMDRLICGDVGFGKTEVAMRAAFTAVQGGKQVAILAPTTLLATQHLQNFRDRFASWPVKVAGLSRMIPAKEQALTLKGLESGNVDIVIGTHKLLSDTVKYKDLGLLIIDEEQRFGVRQKERITSLRAHIDILTLTATPIPRTLNMALSGTRDLSIIATPPLRRLSVKTFVHETNEALIREAILRETLRGGQIYFLHNEVSTIEAQAEKLRKIAPEARIRVGHGQMRERELESVMADFYHHRFNVLVSSTIIESGIDIPNANTIIINRADRFGLSQLHQLRGRVGRSHHQAYAYLLTPGKKAMTRDAKKRLEAIAELGDLGVGFSLATHDLEIRGAGELLGEEQSGQMHAIGFSLYMELLEEAVDALKSGREPCFEKPLNSGIEVDLAIPALLPKTYVGDVQVRLSLYKRLANAKSIDAIQTLKSELIDRFGLLPDPAQNLVEIAKVKLTAASLGIAKIETGSTYGYLHFSSKPNLDLHKLILLIQKLPKKYQLQGQEKLRYLIEDKSAEEKIIAINKLLAKISP